MANTRGERPTIDDQDGDPEGVFDGTHPGSSPIPKPSPRRPLTNSQIIYRANLLGMDEAKSVQSNRWNPDLTVEDKVIGMSGVQAALATLHPESERGPTKPTPVSESQQLSLFMEE